METSWTTNSLCMSLCSYIARKNLLLPRYVLMTPPQSCPHPNFMRNKCWLNAFSVVVLRHFQSISRAYTQKDSITVKISQHPYISKINISDSLDQSTKPEINREMTTDEISQLRYDAGKLAWIALGTSPLSAFQASAALQRNRDQKVPPLSTLRDTRQVLRYIQAISPSSIIYVPLDASTIHIRLYTDGAYQNLPIKHSQVGFITVLADKNDTFNIIHWRSSRAPRRPHSTEQSELMALDVSLSSLENLSMIVFSLIKRVIPIVVYNDCETLWLNLMNDTIPTIPEIGYRYREPIANGRIAFTCLIPGDLNSADATTKAKPNSMLTNAIRTNKCITPCKRVFMSQDSPFRHLS